MRRAATGADGHARGPEGRHGLWARASLAAAACLAPLLLCLLAARLELTVPAWVHWESRELSCDLDADGACERLLLQGRRVRVLADDGGELYASDASWLVSDVVTGDADGDGLPELLMLVWRRGNYGTSQPFWDTAPDLRMTQHLYVMGLRGGKVRPVWMSHELGTGLQAASVEVPSPAHVSIATRQGETSLWAWDCFGFSRDL